MKRRCTCILESITGDGEWLSSVAMFRRAVEAIDGAGLRITKERVKRLFEAVTTPTVTRGEET